MTKKLTELPVASSVAPADLLLIVAASDGLSKSARAELVGGAGGASVSSFFDDFLFGVSSMWDDAGSSGTGTITFLNAADADADEGVGILELDTGAAAGIARYEHGAGGVPFRSFRGSLPLVAELRVKAPLVPGDIGFVFGFADGSSTIQAQWAEGGGATWGLGASSLAGGGGPTVQGSAIVVTSGWHTVRLELDPGVEARLYVDDALVATITSASDVPQGADEMTAFFEASTAGATAGDAHVDWFRVRVDRA